MSKEYIASVLKRLRAEQGMTADEVGEIIGKSGKTVSGWENARSQPDADLLLKLCEIYKVENILDTFSEIKRNVKPIESKDDTQKLLHNYHLLNDSGKEKLLEYSEDLLGSGNYTNKVYQIKTAARDGSFKTTTVTDDDLKKLMDLPDVDDLK